jgi:spermidine synthase
MKVVRTRRGARIVDGRDVLSEIRSTPGATHSLFDILAASIAGLTRGPRFAMLGFAGGGVVAPLRALQFEHPIHAVDLSATAEPLFRRLCGAWAGDVQLSIEDAAEWLQRQSEPFDVVLEDLTMPAPGGAIKPAISLEVLPQLIAARLSPHGVAITNLLPQPKMSWPQLLSRIAAPHRHASWIECADFENRLVVAGPGAPASPREAAASIRMSLRRLQSRQMARIAAHRIP